MTILLDSHALIWFLTGNRRCPQRVREIIETQDNVLVSAASAWEIATKVRLGKWPEAANIAANMMGVLIAHAFSTLDVTLEHGLLAGTLPGRHGDPFDRMLAAQAQIDDLPIVTNDPVFDQYGVNRIW